jgi:hypothetical protein
MCHAAPDAAPLVGDLFATSLTIDGLSIQK